MIWMALENAPSPVKLFRNDNPHELVGKGKGRQRQRFVCPPKASRVQTIGTADQQGYVLAPHAPIRQLACQCLGVAGATMLVEGDHPVVTPYRLEQSLSLLRPRTAFARRNLHKFQGRLGRQATGIFRKCFAHPRPRFVTNGDETNLQTAIRKA